MKILLAIKILLWRLLYAIAILPIHAKEMKQLQPTWSFWKRCKANGLFFMLCLTGVVGPYVYGKKGE